MRKRTFTAARHLPPHADGLSRCWCGGCQIGYIDPDGNQRITYFHNDDLGFAFGFIPLPTMILLCNPISDDYAVEPPPMTPRLVP